MKNIEVIEKFLVGFLSLISGLIFLLTIITIFNFNGDGKWKIGNFVFQDWLKSDLQYLAIVFILFAIIYGLNKRTKR